MVVAVAELSRPLAMVMVISSGSLGTSGNKTGGTITMVGNAKAVGVAGLSRPLADTLSASGNIAGAAMTMVGNGRSIVVTIAGLGRPLANTMMNIQAIMRVGPGHMLVAVTTIVVSIAGLSRPLANTLSASGNIAGAAITMIGNGRSVVVTIAGLSRPLAKMVESMIVAMGSLRASCNITSGSIAVVSHSWAVIAEASFSSDTAQNGKNGDQFNCHGADGPSSVRRMSH